MPARRLRSTHRDPRLKRFACERHGPEHQAFTSASLDEAGSDVCQAIDEIQRLRDAIRTSGWTRPTHKPVAVIGAGPAGLACGHDLALLGIPVVIFESEPVPAGMLALGVPEYRLPRDSIRAEIEVIQALGVEIRCSTAIGKDVTFDQLRRDFAAVVIAIGAKRRGRCVCRVSMAPTCWGEWTFSATWRWASRPGWACASSSSAAATLPTTSRHGSAADLPRRCPDRGPAAGSPRRLAVLSGVSRGHARR